ncbi:MAG: hypothetical protein HYV26_20765 [Candidatus Hydrogenedentes bacterium]|nr:hypothetical protein [Candidatus Hydrogenedentota bacterium]
MGKPVVMSSGRLATRRQGVDLFALSPVRALVLWPGFPYAFQGVLLVVFAVLVVLGWTFDVPDAVDAKLYAKSNLVTLVVWGLWWPSMVWMAVLLGRAWCMVCPLELVANITERAGAKLGVRQFNLSRPLRAGWLIVFLYFLLQLLVSGAALHRIPKYTALFMFGLLTGAAVVGLLWRDRAFCRGFCPVGLLLSTYGRGGMLAVRPAGVGACAQCAAKYCIAKNNRTRVNARSCPSLLNPPKLNSNKDCLLCGQCIKACRPDNMQLLLRRPFDPADAREPHASWPTTLFVMMVSGFVMSEVVSGWPRMEETFDWLPERLSEWMASPALAGWLKGLWYLGVYPLALWMVLGGLVVVLGGAATLRLAWRRLALPVAVIVAAAHMSKGIEKISTWGGFLPWALKSPDGTETALAIAAKSLPAPAPLLPHFLYAGIGLALLAAGLFFGAREARLSGDTSSNRLYVPLAVAAMLYLGCVGGWAFR